MGYYTRFTGELTLSRPLNYTEIQAVGKVDDFELVLDEAWEERPEGVLKAITAERIRVKDGDEIRAYNAEAQLSRMAAFVPRGVTLSGEIRGEGTDAGDVRRYVPQLLVNGGWRVREMKARLVWEDGHEESRS